MDAFLQGTPSGCKAASRQLIKKEYVVLFNGIATLKRELA